MSRLTNTRARALLPTAAIACVSLACCAGAWAAPSAVDEYQLDAPGAPQSPVTTSKSGARLSRAPETQAGVVGEATPPQSPLEAGASALADDPVVPIAAIGLILAATAGPALLRSRRRPRAG